MGSGYSTSSGYEEGEAKVAGGKERNDYDHKKVELTVAEESELIDDIVDENDPPKKRYYVSERIDNILLKSLPPINYDAADLHNNHIAFPSSALYIAAWVGLFAYLFTVGVQTATGSQFLSLDGTSDSQVCEDVPQPLTGTYSVDKYGIWNVEPGHQRNSSFLEFEFTGTEVTLQEYTAVIEKFRDVIISYDSKMQTRDLSYAMLAWLNIQEYDADSKITMRTTAQYETIFAEFNQFSVDFRGFEIPSEVSSGGTAAVQTCYTRDPTTTIQFDPNADSNRPNPPFVSISEDNAFYKFSWDLDSLRINDSIATEYYNSFNRNILQPCGNIFRLASRDELDNLPNLLASHINSAIGSKMGDFTRDFDIRSIIVACAMNKGIITKYALDETDYQPYGFEQFNLKLYTHPKFPGMRPVMCSFNSTEVLCFIYSIAYSNTRIAYPQMTQKANLFKRPNETTYCQCSGNKDDHRNCQTFSFEIGVIEFAESIPSQFVSSIVVVDVLMYICMCAILFHLSIYYFEYICICITCGPILKTIITFNRQHGRSMCFNLSGLSLILMTYSYRIGFSIRTDRLMTPMNITYHKYVHQGTRVHSLRYIYTTAILMEKTL